MTKVFYEKLSGVCHNLLQKNKNVLKYLKEARQLSDETIELYQIGYFPKDLRLLFGSISAVELKENNIVWNAERSPFKFYPIVIPIRDVRGRPIAIGCRTLLNEERRKDMGIPKYRNSEYEKGLYLFNLDKAVKYIRQENCVYVVEGYFDAIMAYQRGIRNVVATCGTSFTMNQYIILSRYTNNINLLFDNDTPGHRSAEIVMKKLDKFDEKPTCLFTPENYKDLDEFLRKGGSFSLIGKEQAQVVNY